MTENEEWDLAISTVGKSTYAGRWLQALLGREAPGGSRCDAANIVAGAAGHGGCQTGLFGGEGPAAVPILAGRIGLEKVAALGIDPAGGGRPIRKDLLELLTGFKFSLGLIP